MSSRKNFSIGIDIGAGGIKLVLLERSKEQGIRLLHAEFESIDNFDQQESHDQAAVLDYLLKKFLRKEKNLVNARVGVSIAGQSAFVRLVRIPMTSPQKLRQIVLYETQQQVPFPIKDVVWDFQVCSKA